MEDKKTHWKRLTGAKFLGAWDFEPKEERVVKFENVQQEEVMNLDGKTEPCIIAYFEGLKPMILNKTNMKAITKSTGTAFIEDWIGQEVTLFTCQVKAFGDTVDAIRIKPTKPKPKAKPVITQERFEKAIEAAKAGKYDATKLPIQFALSAEQVKTLNELKTK